MAHAVGTNSPLGKAFDLDLKEGVLPAWSLRALGSIEQTRRGAEVRNLRLITWDNVIYPSHPGAYTQRLVSESANSGSNMTNIQRLISENAEFDNSIEDTGFASPIINQDVIKFIQTESSNLKFVRECFDFAYNSISVNESGTKVILSANDGDTLVVNIESYIHDELMNYSKDYINMKENGIKTESFSILH